MLDRTAEEESRPVARDGQEDVEQLTSELGLNLAGVEQVLHMQDELTRVRRRLARLEREMREAISEVHRQYRRDLVVYKPPTDLERTK